MVGWSVERAAIVNIQSIGPCAGKDPNFEAQDEQVLSGVGKSYRRG